ncbi:MAG: radical SAM protein, partial [Candidatus Aenigmatarchaeota archaeon]
MIGMEQKGKGYVTNDFNTHRFEDNSYLVTTEQGSWSLLTRDEYKKLESSDLEPESDLFKHLEDRGIVITEDNVEEIVKKHALKNQFLFTGPSLHIITTTKRCNHRCSYCHSMPVESDEKRFDVDVKTGKRIVDFALKTNSEIVNFEFQGGEPLLNFSTVKKIMDYAEKEGEEKGKRVGFSIVSNLTELDEKTIEDLKQRDINITTSLDGPEELHNTNRNYLGGGGTHGDVVQNIRRLRENGVGVNALCTITRDSLGRGEEIVDEYDRLDLDKIWLRPLNKIGFAEENWNRVGYTAEQFTEFYRETLHYITEEREGMKELYATLLARKILGIKDPEMTEMTSPCGAGISQLMYDRNGDIYTCDEGKIFDE